MSIKQKGNVHERVERDSGLLRVGIFNIYAIIFHLKGLSNYFCVRLVREQT